MGKLNQFLFVGLLLVGMNVSAAQQTVLTFEDRSNQLSLLDKGYGGFDWGTSVYSMNWSDNGYGGTGYQFGTTSGNNVAFSSDASVSINWLGSGLIDFLSANWTSAYQTHNLSFEGWSAGNLKYQSGSYQISNTAPNHISLNWSGIDRIVVKNDVAGYGYQWAMDDFTFVTPIPEPASNSLLLAGLLLIASVCWSRQRSESMAQ